MYNKTNVMPRTIGGMIEDLFQNGFNRMWAEEPAETSAQAPVNIQEGTDSYELQLIAPGLKKEDFKVNIDRNILTISYDHTEDAATADQETKLLRREYRFKSFKRSFTLNDKIDASGISARYTDGILYLNLPKKEVQLPMTQQISVG